ECDIQCRAGARVGDRPRRQLSGDAGWGEVAAGRWDAARAAGVLHDPGDVGAQLLAGLRRTAWTWGHASRRTFSAAASMVATDRGQRAAVGKPQRPVRRPEFRPPYLGA